VHPVIYGYIDILRISVYFYPPSERGVKMKEAGKFRLTKIMIHVTPDPDPAWRNGCRFALIAEDSG